MKYQCTWYEKHTAEIEAVNKEEALKKILRCNVPVETIEATIDYKKVTVEQVA